MIPPNQESQKGASCAELSGSNLAVTLTLRIAKEKSGAANLRTPLHMCLGQNLQMQSTQVRFGGWKGRKDHFPQRKLQSQIKRKIQQIKYILGCKGNNHTDIKPSEHN